MQIGAHTNVLRTGVTVRLLLGQEREDATGTNEGQDKKH